MKQRIKQIDQHVKDEVFKHDEIEKLANLLLQFNEEKPEARLHSKVSQIEGKIDFCKKRINKLVYQLYGLNEGEIELVESAVKSL